MSIPMTNINTDDLAFVVLGTIDQLEWYDVPYWFGIFETACTDIYWQKWERYDNVHFRPVNMLHDTVVPAQHSIGTG
jgi:hypothetical protein